jgi:Domain of unknown function (DUF5664)
MTTDQIFNEQDPNGLTAHSHGAKLDAGKPMAGYVIGDFSLALQEVIKVGTFGATKYTRSGWMGVTEGEERYTDAMMRHFLAEQSGEDIDPDSQCLHAAQVAWNALARLHFIILRMQ